MIMDKNETGKDFDQYDIVVSWPIYPQIYISYMAFFRLIETDAFWYKYGDSQEPSFLWKDISMNKMQ